MPILYVLPQHVGTVKYWLHFFGGVTVGPADGVAVVGEPVVGFWVGAFVGANVGESVVGFLVGAKVVGAGVGATVGLFVVGTPVLANLQAPAYHVQIGSALQVNLVVKVGQLLSAKT